jgi:hypothetical protein
MDAIIPFIGSMSILSSMLLCPIPSFGMLKFLLV